MPVLAQRLETALRQLIGELCLRGLLYPQNRGQCLHS